MMLLKKRDFKDPKVPNLYMLAPCHQMTLHLFGSASILQAQRKQKCKWCKISVVI
jgi:hypothetical protein